MKTEYFKAIITATIYRALFMSQTLFSHIKYISTFDH